MRAVLLRANKPEETHRTHRLRANEPLRAIRGMNDIVLPLSIVGAGQGLLVAWWRGTIADASFGGATVSGALLGFGALIGASLAHTANNLANDWRDYHDGLDRPGYPRADYSPHPIASGAMSSRTLLVAIGILTALAALLGGFAMVVRGEALLGDEVHGHGAAGRDFRRRRELTA